MTIDTSGKSGLPFERTSLAWNRTALTAAALGATTVKPGIADHSVLNLLATGVSLVAAVTIYICSRWRHPVGEAPVGRTAILIATISAVFAGLAATVVVAVHAAGS